MARAHSIWVAMHLDRTPMATFTVRHELISWLQRNQMPCRPSWVARFEDGFDPLAPDGLAIPVYTTNQFLQEFA